MRRFKEILIRKTEFTELDLEYPFYGPDLDEDGDTESNEFESSLSLDTDLYAEAPSMSIDDAINALQNLKDEGANRVYFYAHNDHQGYIITGVNVQEL